MLYVQNNIMWSDGDKNRKLIFKIGCCIKFFFLCGTQVANLCSTFSAVN